MEGSIHGVTEIRVLDVEEFNDRGEKFYVRKVIISSKDSSGKHKTSLTSFSDDKKTLEIK